MKIIIDENIPQAKEAFDSFGDLTFINGRKITNQLLKDCDIMIIRSITRVDEQLLHNTNVKFVGTATAGTDHIDQEYLKKNNIKFASAAGCNSFSVAEYFICALMHIYNKNNFSLQEKTIGIVGIGNVGSKVANFAKLLGLNVLMNDPPLERKFGSKNFIPLNDILKCDIITLHVPLNIYGTDKTLHLIDNEKLSQIKSGSVLINTSRGEVVDNFALKNRLNKHNDLITVLDVWENEPIIDYELLKLVNIGTAHIAGYSLEGKINGTKIIHDELCKFLNFPTTWEPIYPPIKNSSIEINSHLNYEGQLHYIFKQIYNIEEDDLLLRAGLNKNLENQKVHFDVLRKQYSIRREFNNYNIKSKLKDAELKNKLTELRFQVI